MYSDVVTVFCRRKSRSGDMWYPTVIHGANLNVNRAAIVAKYGADSKDNAVLNIHYATVEEQIAIAEKIYFLPKEWQRQSEEKIANSITFTAGVDFDFFMEGEYECTGPIRDDDYTDGFYNYMNSNYDNVFSITSVAKYSVIPHFEIMGA